LSSDRICISPWCPARVLFADHQLFFLGAKAPVQLFDLRGQFPQLTLLRQHACTLPALRAARDGPMPVDQGTIERDQQRARRETPLVKRPRIVGQRVLQGIQHQHMAQHRIEDPVVLRLPREQIDQATTNPQQPLVIGLGPRGPVRGPGRSQIARQERCPTLAFGAQVLHRIHGLSLAFAKQRTQAITQHGVDRDFQIGGRHDQIGQGLVLDAALIRFPCIRRRRGGPRRRFGRALQQPPRAQRKTFSFGRDLRQRMMASPLLVQLAFEVLDIAIQPRDQQLEIFLTLVGILPRLGQVHPGLVQSAKGRVLRVDLRFELAFSPRQPLLFLFAAHQALLNIVQLPAQAALRGLATCDLRVLLPNLSLDSVGDSAVLGQAVARRLEGLFRAQQPIPLPFTLDQQPRQLT
jgi:hypothetical protein